LRRVEKKWAGARRVEKRWGKRVELRCEEMKNLSC
jgi:hypothetical protein